MPIVHLTARMRAPLACLTDDEKAPWLWTRLRSAFPAALGTTLMPNHPHLVAEVDDPVEAHSRFVHVLGALARRVARSPRLPVWEPIPPPQIIEGPGKVARQLRYSALNPARAQLADDVLGWKWSTHLDVVGAADDPWVVFDRLRRFVPFPLGASLGTWHAYVSADSHTHVGGTPLPRPVGPQEIAARPLAEILEAVACATRSRVQDVARKGATRSAFVWLAREQGWARVSRIAEVCRITRRSVARILAAPMPSAVAPARLCLDLPRRRRATARRVG